MPAKEELSKKSETASSTFQGVVIDKGPKKVIRDVKLKQLDPIRTKILLVSETGIIKVTFSRPIHIKFKDDLLLRKL